MVEYIQTVVKDEEGIGSPINIHFYAPLDESKAKHETEICYDSWQQMPEDIELIQADNYSQYAEKYCLKICWYLQKVRAIEILQMKAEFFKD